MYVNRTRDVFMERAKNHGNATAKKAGAVYSVTKIWTTVPIIGPAKMVEPASIPAMDHTHANVHRVLWETNVKLKWKIAQRNHVWTVACALMIHFVSTIDVNAQKVGPANIAKRKRSRAPKNHAHTERARTQSTEWYAHV